MYKQEQTCNIPRDQIYRLNCSTMWMRACFSLTKPHGFSEQPRDSQSQIHCKDRSWQHFWLEVNWLLAILSISSARGCAMSKALVPLAKKSIFYLSSNGFLNKSQWFIQPYCVSIHPLCLGHRMLEQIAAIIQAVILWTQGEESSSELLVTDLMPRKTHLQHRNHHTSMEANMNAFSGEKNERPRERLLKKMRPW